ncbi:prophage pi2 protein 27 [Lactococcus lactis subsp. lactis]|jgi:hypothetical protein|uniref:Prophage pi2 protein 27 n=1 Tax=Lactococcus lactis subsp. lactis TaxID=1360 RepID=A0A0V8CZS4_LACLL|nr:DUF722 domain-containing protein [Lactococcus lactis]KSU06832.1 prophage pi2 protein 27 [Lactococcus lactis subsp. lactis]
MGDSLDELISDYITGMLEVKINCRKEANESIGNERILESDLDYQKKCVQKAVLDGMMVSIDGLLIKQIIIARFKYHLTWINVGNRVCVEESTARKQYVKFKKNLRKNLKASLIEK